MDSTLGQLFSFKKIIETIGIKVRAIQDTKIEFNVYITDECGDEERKFKVYGSSIQMHKTDDYEWMSLPINLYLDDPNFRVEIAPNPSVLIDDETWNNATLVAC